MPQITMIEDVWDGPTLLGKGSTPTVSTELADQLVSAGKASDTSGYRYDRTVVTRSDDDRVSASGRVPAGMPRPSAVVSYRPLTHSLLSGYGIMPQLYRAAVSGGRPYVIDYKGRFIRTSYGECLFHGARRVENKLSHSGNLTNAVWTATSGGAIAAVYDSKLPGKDGGQTLFKFTKAAVTGSVFRRNSGAVYPAKKHVASAYVIPGPGVTDVEIRVHIAGSTTLATKLVTGLTPGERYRIAVGCLPDGTSSYVIGVTPHGYGSAAAGVLYVEAFQMEEDRDGLGIPSEYVENTGNPSSRFWHGAGVDGVKYFNTTSSGMSINSNGVVTEAPGALIDRIMGVMTFPSAIQQIQNNNLASGWTASNATVTDGEIGPDGEPNAIKINEGTGSGVSHHIQRTLTGVGAIASAAAYNGETWHPFITVVEKTVTPIWMRLFVQDVAGAGWSAYFNTTGVKGTITNGHLSIYQHPDNDDWLLVIWGVRVRNGSGSSDPIVRISMAGGDNTPTYTGTSREVKAWLPCYFTSTSTSGSAAAQRPVYVPPTLSGGAASTSPGQAISFSVEGVLGRTDFAICSTFYPFYEIEQTDKQQYTGTTYIRTTAPGETRGTTPYNLDAHRTGISIRPPLSGGAANCKFAMDFYNGDPNPLYFWKPNTFYPAGSYVIPTDTQPNNDNGRKVFRTYEDGTSGAVEPSWNTTFEATTADGGLTWHCDIPNGINSTWEPYSGSELLADQGFLGQYKAAWFIRDDDYGMFINGVEGYKQTHPNPCFPEKGWTLDYSPKTLFLGTLGSNSGQFPEAVPSGQEHAVCPVHAAIHRDVTIWVSAPSRGELAGYTSQP